MVCFMDVENSSDALMSDCMAGEYSQRLSSSSEKNR